MDLQSTVQKYIDSAISSTVNLPANTTVEDVEELYLYAWKKKLKGITIYVQDSMREGILTTSNSEKESTSDRIQELQDELNREIVKSLERGICPECGMDNMIHESNCVTCQDCGYSPCSI